MVQLNTTALVYIMAWRRQAIIWTNDGLIYRRIYASLCLDDCWIDIRGDGGAAVLLSVFAINWSDNNTR